MAKENLKMIKIASASHPHGIKGEVELKLVNPHQDESILREGMTVFITPLDQQWVIKKLRFGNKAICLFEGIKDRTHLESMLPFELWVHREDFPELDENEIYLADLVDYKVIGPEGQDLGVLESFSDNGMQYLLDVRLKDGALLTLPFVEAFFPHLDQEHNTLTMIMPEYTE
jgi:16S rRNA processing protein RimM